MAYSLYLRKVLLHIAFWSIVYLVWVIIFHARALTFTKTLTVQFCFLFFTAANYYLHATILLPRLLFKGNYLTYFLSAFLLLLLSSLARVPIAMYLNMQYFHSDGVLPGFAPIFTDSLLNIGVWVILFVSFRLLYDRLRLQQYAKNMESEKNRAEIDFLNAQFNPHFLFNSINAIYGQIDRSNPEARKMLLRFSDMLRYQLYECNTDRIPVEKEVQYLENYVSIQQSRKETSLQVSCEMDEALRGFFIAPLLFVGFIENAFKYVSNREDQDNYIQIRLWRQEDHLHFFCLNSKDDQIRPSIDHKGIGMQNVKKRLEILYPGAYSLALNEQDHFYEVRLKLKIDEDQLPGSRR